jgi:hypothetical protein
MKILYFNDMSEFFSQNEDWKVVMDISDIWNKYTTNQLTIEQFNKEYSNRILTYKNNIISLGNDIWEEVNILTHKLINTSIREESIKLYDDIYDWGDKNDVLIKTK